MANTVIAKFLIQVNNRLSIAVGRKTVATPLQIWTKFRVVVNFTVKHNPDATVLVAHRLVPAGQVYNAQSSEAQRQRTGEESSSIIRSAMTQNPRHGFQLFIRRPVAAQVENSANSTHRFAFEAFFTFG